jgi:hypothetical protein
VVVLRPSGLDDAVTGFYSGHMKYFNFKPWSEEADDPPEILFTLIKWSIFLMILLVIFGLLGGHIPWLM